jgi:hypothetical protein
MLQREPKDRLSLSETLKRLQAESGWFDFMHRIVS